MNKDAEREAFEQFWGKTNKPTNSRHWASTVRNDDARDGEIGEYIMRATNDAWVIWKAAMASQAERLAELELKVVAQQARIVEWKDMFLNWAEEADFAELGDFGVCMREAVLTLTLDDLSALREHEAGVLEEAAKWFDDQSFYKVESHQKAEDELRRMAAERGQE